jgi:signal transduction histidine kinase
MFKLLDIENEFNAQEQDTILVRKGNQIHLVLLYLTGAYGVLYALVNWYQGYDMQALINFISVIFTAIAFYLNHQKFYLPSKILNLIQLIVVISLMFYFSAGFASHEADSILVFFIPISLGTLIVFQGQERKYGYVIAIMIFTLMVVLMTIDKHYEPDTKIVYSEGVSSELILNLTGATLATFLEVTFILILSNKIDEKLLKTNKELDSFVYSVSHDLRSPLLSVRGLLQLSMDGVGENKDLESYLKMAAKSIDHLDETIQEILAYSRNTRIEVQYQQINVEELIDQIYGDLRHSVSDQFLFQKEVSGSPMLFSDKTRVNTILRNLIGNAVKYKKESSEVSFVKTTILSEQNQMVIKVEDNGEGISKDNLLKVFDMFYRATTTSQGTGLGLYICKEMLLKLHGKIEAKSDLDKGTSMIVTIPNIEQ